MAKRDISMPPAEVDEFLAGREHMVVGAIAADGWPVGTIGATSFVHGRLHVALVADDPVRDALATDPRICCVSDVHDSYYEIRGAMVHGTLDADETVAVEQVISFDFGRLR